MKFLGYILAIILIILGVFGYVCGGTFYDKGIVMYLGIFLIICGVILLLRLGDASKKKHKK